MNTFESLYFKLVPIFSAIFIIYGVYELYTNFKIGNFERMKIFIFITVLFVIAFIASLILIFKKK